MCRIRKPTYIEPEPTVTAGTNEDGTYTSETGAVSPDQATSERAAAAIQSQERAPDQAALYEEAIARAQGRSGAAGTRRTILSGIAARKTQPDLATRGGRQSTVLG